jgi:OmcA/MtrC family decaheme c-type cytochrome
MWVFDLNRKAPPRVLWLDTEGNMSARPSVRRARAIAVFALAAACNQTPPAVGPAVDAPLTAAGPAVALTAAKVNAARQVYVMYRVTKDGKPVTDTAAAALAPRWTLAALGTEPVSGLRAWYSHLLTGAQTAPSLPIAGPGTPAAQVRTNATQPGVDAGGTLQSLGDGTFIYTFGTPLPAGYDDTETLRVGVWLDGAPTGTSLTAATLDFVPGGGSPLLREVVRDEDCGQCHGTPRGHDGKRTNTRLCVTCHTWQSSDPDTVDPAAPAAATAATNPNPLEFGRLIHRVHRGKYLPTLYKASSPDAAPDLLTTTTALPLPFASNRTSATGTNPPVLGRRFSVVRSPEPERVYGRILSRSENGQPGKTLAAGILFPRDYRDCDACHAGAAQATIALTQEISRRTCHGCHADVWFDTAVPPDQHHLAHPGGIQADDSACAGCHVAGGATPYAPLAEVHGAIVKNPRYSKPAITILEVRDFKPGLHPTIVFTVSDRNGYLDSLLAPTPAYDQQTPASPVPRALTRLSLTVGGPETDFSWVAVPLTATTSQTLVPVSETIIPVPTGGTAPVADAQKRFSYTMTWTVPDFVQGKWFVTVETRRSLATTHFHTDTDTFDWPYTGETVTEYNDNAFAWFTTGAAGPATLDPAARRQVVSTEKCNACHLRLGLHGGGRNQVENCLVCHAPERTDWSRRPKLSPSNLVNLSTISTLIDGTTGLPTFWGTYDNVEERTIHFKVMIHRIHTGAGSGPAALSESEPFTIYGNGTSPLNAFFFDEAKFPGDLADCTLCHVGKSYLPEEVPASALPTLANETAGLMHTGTAIHVEGEPAVLPMRAACLGCHDTAAAWYHSGKNTAGTTERCPSCHGEGASYSVTKVHRLQ